MPGTKSITATETQRKTQCLPPYKVVLHNDDVNTFAHVIRTILKITPLKEPDAVTKTIEAHETGQAVLLITNQERAELYVEQFATFSLVVTGEPDA
jgi:ATP-dependent Clp protease adaptor protein ClpS